jgi:hypothetical protein
MTAKNNIKNLPAFVLTAFLGMLGSVLIGILFFGIKVFSPKLMTFQFVAVGFVGAVFYSTLKFFRLKDAIYILILFFFFQEIAFKSLSMKFIIRDVIFFITLGISIYIFVRFFYDKLSQLKFGKFLTFGSLILIGGIVATVILAIIFRANLIPAVLENASMGILLGLGLGLGLEISEKILKKK